MLDLAAHSLGYLVKSRREHSQSNEVEDFVLSDSFANEISQQLAQLTPEQQQDVLEFVRSLQSQPTKEQRRQSLLDLAGSIPPEDIKIMKSVIEADCGRIDSDGW